MATTYKIHPAIGIARVGNSPDEFFIGPERVGEQPDPPGGFKDAQCRVKRQAARFRIFAHHDGGTVEEITAAQADITWTVHVANTKAAFGPRANPEPAADLSIDPGSRSLSAPNGAAQFDGGTITFAGESAVEVPLGEMRTDTEGRLLVLGGSGHSASPTGDPIQTFWDSEGWYDDVSDGPVSASITLHGSGDTPTVAGSWVIVAPPKFAPHQDSVTTLYDRLAQKMIDDGELTAPPVTSYTNDVYPILKRAEDMAWVEGLTANHTWVHPVTTQSLVDYIFSRVSDPAAPGGLSNMPPLNGSDGKLTPTQYTHLERWQAGTYTNDWVGEPAPEADVTPEGMDQAALEACVGGAFFPGIEAGGRSAAERPILLQPYTEAFRLDHGASGPGDISASMALPWQADFKACGDYWWPVPRPNDVFTEPGGSTVRWDRDVATMEEMVTEWNTLGFVVRQGDVHLEVERCDTTSINLLTPSINFVDVPQGPMAGVREIPMAITFEVISPGGEVVLEYTPTGGPSHSQLVADNTSVAVGPTDGTSVATARLWLIFRTDAAGTSMPTQTLTVRQQGTGRTWEIEVDGNTVARTTTGLAFALDRSGSMNQDRGDGQTKHDSLQQAANMFVDLMLEGDGAGVVRFNHNAQPLTDVLELGNGLLSDSNRAAVHDAISGTGLNPGGSTSIGDGVHEARAALDSAPVTYDRDALLVLTDGIENEPKWLSDVSADIDAKTYAVGFGKPENISIAALQTLAGNSGGSLQVTGPITGDNRFRLQKYFLQVLSGVNNSEVVLDPDGELHPSQVAKIPFVVSEADTGVEVILLTPDPNRVDFRLVSPLGQIIEPWVAQAEPMMHFDTSDQTAFYRVSLPIQVQPGRFDQVGTWHALLRMGEPRVGPNFNRTEHTILRPGGLARNIDPEPPPLEAHRRFELARAHPHQPGASATSPGGTSSTSAVDLVRPKKGLPYSLVVHAYSNLSFEAAATQDRYTPGAVVELEASVSQSGRPLKDVAVWATISGPGGSEQEVGLERNRAGQWRGKFVAEKPGVHEIRMRANGKSRKGLRFTRERLLTAQVWIGADRPNDPASDPGPPKGGGGEEPGRPDPGHPGPEDCSWCEILAPLIGPNGVIDYELWARLATIGVDVEKLRECIKACQHGSGQ